MRVFNVFDGELHFDGDELPGYRAPYASAGKHIGAERLAGNVVLLEPGEAVCPYHYELADEEWLLVLEGTPSVRRPSGEVTLEAGDIVCFARGPGGAHKIFNASRAAARVLIVSERRACAAAIYPDSDKVGVFAPDVRLLFRRSDQRDYYDGEGAG